MTDMSRHAQKVMKNDLNQAIFQEKNSTKKNLQTLEFTGFVAERVGFEPTVSVTPHTISKHGREKVAG